MSSNPPKADADRPLRIPPVESPRHDDALLDQAVAETFPASDPISPAVPSKLEPGDVRREQHAASGERFLDRLAHASPAVIGLGTAALAWIVMRALSSERSDDDRYDDAVDEPYDDR